MIIEHHESLNGAIILSRSISGKITGLGEKNFYYKNPTVYINCVSLAQDIYVILYTVTAEIASEKLHFEKLDIKFYVHIIVHIMC